ncbi:4-hydroxythreonine-4-phosphate dehydrogenase PdxA [Candidatus Saganbacteria bacterium]|nr:4-hydroxythreonine-4-phosphate dehydrogenase PdxA [Candidatus Saganbacteria bacterium]
MGDPAGIGPEICVKALASSELQNIADCVIIGDKRALRQALKVAKLPDLEINLIKKISDVKFSRGVIDLVDLANVPTNLKIGQVSKVAGQAAVAYVKKTCQLAMDGQIDAMATAPINKAALAKAGFAYEGHTEILARQTKAKRHAMMFVSPAIWVMLATIHVPLAEVSKNLDRKKILDAIKLAHETLRKLLGKKPRIGVAGLNPHAGENGLCGTEEVKIIGPAVAEAKKLGLNVKGPLPPDTIFHMAHIGLFDIVLAMYHDQGLIPLKLLSFNKSVNVTVGLPILRTSVDHGTGFDIAGLGIADPSSMIEAIKVAARFATLST